MGEGQQKESGADWRMDLEPIGIRLFDTRGTAAYGQAVPGAVGARPETPRGVSLTDERTIVRKVGRIVVVGNGTAI